MNDLDRALGDIRSLRRQVVQNMEFHGYGPLTLCITAAFAIVAGVVQSAFVSQPAIHPFKYVAIWTTTALLCASLMTITTLTRARRIHSGLSSEMIRMATEQFLPAIIAGALVTLVIVSALPHAIWLLPIFWQIISSLGVFSSCRFLPRPMLAAGAWYMLTGLGCLALGNDRTLAPHVMAGAYAVGQLLIAAILYFYASETPDEE
jgi:hypothetical protein